MTGSSWLWVWSLGEGFGSNYSLKKKDKSITCVYLLTYTLQDLAVGLRTIIILSCDEAEMLFGDVCKTGV